MSDIEISVLRKLVAMFSPHGPGQFLGFPGEDVINGPNDRAMFGFDNRFPKQWLIEDFDFTPEEADWLVKAVHEQAKRAPEETHEG